MEFRDYAFILAIVLFSICAYGLSAGVRRLSHSFADKPSEWLLILYRRGKQIAWSVYVVQVCLSLAFLGTPFHRARGAWPLILLVIAVGLLTAQTSKELSQHARSELERRGQKSV
jgi:hypothetical protein